MKNKIIIILISLLFISSFKVLAGDINNPEIIDEENDMFGSFIDHPVRFQIFQSLGLLTMDSFDFLDILGNGYRCRYRCHLPRDRENS